MTDDELQAELDELNNWFGTNTSLEDAKQAMDGRPDLFYYENNGVGQMLDDVPDL